MTEEPAPTALRFVQVDVFAEQPFGGNQLAVFFDAAALTAEQRQTIAAEMNYAESTFVEPPTVLDADARVRIHTPARELPFAGHPTLGTAYALARAWAAPTGQPLARHSVGSARPAAATLRLELGVGVLQVDVEPCGPRAAFAWMEQPLPRFEPAPTAGLGALVGLSDDEVTVPGLPAEYGSAGILFLLLPMRSLDAVRRARPDAAAMAAQLGGRDHPAVLVFTRETESPEATVHARMFAPLMGITEDAATGSAAGPLGAYLVRHGAVPVQSRTRVVVEQGLEMGRPSRLTVEVTVDEGAVRGVRVGGGVVLVAEGTLYI
jgi:trans-2,3-dihydro-3-hydroxyanthranilate isomerase